MASVTQPAAAAASGKGKGKKSKGQKLDIDEFVNSSNFKMVDSSWADIMEDEDVISPSMQVSLPSAPKSALGPEIDFDAIPNNGPFRAMVANLQYEVNEEQLAELFTGMSITNLRVNTENGRAIGTASVEFATKNDLIDALGLSNKTLNGRAVRIFLPNMDRYGDRGGGGRGGGRSYTDNTPSNWRSADRSAPRAGGENAYGVPAKTFPPPTVGLDRGFGSSRGSRYGDSDGYRPPRSEGFGGGGGGFGRRDDYGGDRRRDGDDFGRRDRFREEGGRAEGSWGRGPPRPASDDKPAAVADGEESAAAPAQSNWRSARAEGPPPQGDRDFGRRDNDRYGRGDGAPPPSRDNYGPPRGGDREFRRRDEGDFRSRDGDFERRGAPSPQGGNPDLYEPQRGSGEFEAPRSFAPAPRERTTSTRSDRSNPDAEGKPAGEEPRRNRPPQLGAAMLANILNNDVEESKPSSYNSIFGSAKPVDTAKREEEIAAKLAAEKAEREAAKAAAAAAAAAAAEEGAEGGGSVTGASPSGSQAGDSTRPHRDRLPRGDGPPRMNRRENGEARGRDGERRFDRGPRREGGGFDDRNGGGFGDRRRGGDRGGFGDRDGRPRMGNDGAGSRMGGDRRREGGRGDFGFGDRGGERRFGGDRRGGDAPRFRDNDGPSDRYFRGGQGAGAGAGSGPGSGGHRDFDRDFERSRYASESDDKDAAPKTSYVTSNKYDYLNAAEEGTSE